MVKTTVTVTKRSGGKQTDESRTSEWQWGWRVRASRGTAGTRVGKAYSVCGGLARGRASGSSWETRLGTGGSGGPRLPELQPHGQIQHRWQSPPQEQEWFM